MQNKVRELAQEIFKQYQKRLVLVAIDGCGGAGKSTVAEKLAAELGNCQIVHIDDFYKPKEQRVEVTEQTGVHVNFEFDKLKQQVLEPLRNGKLATYLTPEGENTEIKPTGYIIIEGLGTLGTELRDYFDYKIWVELPESQRRERGIERDTKEWTKIWDEEYLPQDALYVHEQEPQKQADWILNND